MQVKQIDALHTEAAKRSVARAARIGGRAIEAHQLAIGEGEPEFCGNNDLVPHALNRPTEDFLAMIRAVKFGGIEEGDTELDGVTNGGNGFRIVTCAVAGHPPSHRHATDTDGRNLQIQA